jgi:hypothetical protein
MVEALSQEVDRSELRERFASDSAASESETIASGRAIPLDAAFDYLEARVVIRKIFSHERILVELISHTYAARGR